MKKYWILFFALLYATPYLFAQKTPVIWSAEDRYNMITKGMRENFNKNPALLQTPQPKLELYKQGEDSFFVEYWVNQKKYSHENDSLYGITLLLFHKKGNAEKEFVFYLGGVFLKGEELKTNIGITVKNTCYNNDILSVCTSEGEGQRWFIIEKKEDKWEAIGHEMVGLSISYSKTFFGGNFLDCNTFEVQHTNYKTIYEFHREERNITHRMEIGSFTDPVAQEAIQKNSKD